MHTDLRCSSCGEVNDVSASFCIACGHSLLASCANCGQRTPLNAQFCPACGHPLDKNVLQSPTPGDDPSAPRFLAEGERRHATVLFSDLSGYTAINEALDPEEVATFMNRLKGDATTIIEAHGGMVNQFVGDEIMALFGIPTAHDDDPRRAVDAAMALHALVRRIGAELQAQVPHEVCLHSAVNSGLMIAQRRDRRGGVFTVTGDAVNTAARVLSACEPDDVLIGPETFRAVSPFFDTECVGPLELRGKTKPVMTYRVSGRAAQSRVETGQERRHHAFQGRESELALLQEHLSKTAQRAGQVVTVTGAPGVGKSRLLYQFRRSLDPEKTYFWAVACRSFGTVAPYSPWAELLRRGLGLHESDTAADLANKTITGVKEFDPTLERYLPIYLYLVSGRSEEYALPPSLAGKALRTAILESLVALIEACGRKNPAVFLFDDWQWADEASAAALRHVAAAVRNRRVFFVVASRSEPGQEQRQTWEGLEPTKIKLDPLTRDETAALMRSLLDSRELPSGLVEFIHERTAGNPLFTEELCNVLTADGVVVEREGRVSLAHSLDGVRVPDTIGAVVRARIDRLDRRAAHVLKLASVIGVEFSLRVLEQLVTVPDTVGRALDRLREAGLVFPLPTRPRPTFRFKHGITRDVTHDTLLHQQRRQLHGLVARAVEELFGDDRLEEHCEELAHHYTEAGELESASGYIEQAGTKAARSFSLEEARKHFRNGIGMLDSMERSPDLNRRRIDMSFRLSECYMHAASSEQIPVLERSFELASELNDQRRAARAVYWMAWIQHALGNQLEAIVQCERCIAMSSALNDDRLLAQIYCNLGQSYAAAIDYKKALENLERGIELTRRVQTEAGTAAQVAKHWRGNAGLAYAIGYLGMIHGEMGDFGRAYELLDEAVAIVEAMRNRSVEGSVRSQYAMCLSYQGNWERCIEAAELIRNIGRHIGSFYLNAMSATFEGYARFNAEQDGIQLLRQAVAQLEGRDALLTMSWNYSTLAEALAIAGDPAEATLYANKALARVIAHDRMGETMAHRALARAAMRRPSPDWEEFHTHMGRALELARQKQSARDAAVTLLHYGEAMRAVGRQGDAAHYLARARDDLSGMDMPAYLVRASAVATG